MLKLRTIGRCEERKEAPSAAWWVIILSMLSGPGFLVIIVYTFKNIQETAVSRNENYMHRLVLRT